MSLTLEITDNQDGTVAILATGDGTTASVYYSTAGENWALLTNSLTEGSEQNFAFASGFYFFYATDDNGDISAVTARTKILDLTSEDAALHQQCLEATQAQLQDLLLADIEPANIIWQKVPDEKSLEADNRTNQAPVASRLPGILICPTGQEKFAGGTNTRDDVGYPVAIFILAKDSKDLTANLSKYLRWREQGIHLLINQRLADVPEIFKADIEPAPIIHQGAWHKGLLASAFTIRFYARRSRGVI